MNTLEEALIDLQTRVAFQEDTINQLNEVVVRQDGELLLIKEQLRMLAERLNDVSRQPSQGEGGLVDERPPHY